jgi:hypothetical protein
MIVKANRYNLRRLYRNYSILDRSCENSNYPFLKDLKNSALEIKRLAFDALEIKVYASPDTLEIKGVIPLELALPTIERTSGCTLNWTYNYKADTKKSVLGMLISAVK